MASDDRPTVHSTALDLAKTTDSRGERWAFLLLASLEESADRRLQRWAARETERQRQQAARWYDGLMGMWRSWEDDNRRREHERLMRETMAKMQSQSAAS